MAICPTSFFCFNKGTFALMLTGVIIVVVFYINANNTRLHTIHNEITENREVNRLTTLENNISGRRNINRYLNPLTPPVRKDPFELDKVGIPINIHTRGYPSGYQQMGVLIEEGKNKGQSGHHKHSEDKILPLFGQETYPGSRLWNYFTKTDGYQAVKLPVTNKKKSCQGGYGCDEIRDDDDIHVRGYNKDFKANIYQLESPQYIPYII